MHIIIYDGCAAREKGLLLVLYFLYYWRVQIRLGAGRLAGRPPALLGVAPAVWDATHVVGGCLEC